MATWQYAVKASGVRLHQGGTADGNMKEALEQSAPDPDKEDVSSSSRGDMSFYNLKGGYVILQSAETGSRRRRYASWPFMAVSTMSAKKKPSRRRITQQPAPLAPMRSATATCG